MSGKIENKKNSDNIFLNQSKKSKTNYKNKSNSPPHTLSSQSSPPQPLINPFTNTNVNMNSETKKVNLDMNNDELFPELALYKTTKTNQVSTINSKNKQIKQIDFLKAIKCSEPIQKEIYDDIDPGWVVMYFDMNKKIRKEYGHSTGVSERLEKERIETYKREINEIFEQRERDIQERIELFGDERLYKPELENYKEPELYYGNESDFEENSLDDNIGDSGYVDYTDDYI
jgi:hypothetical protein